MAGKYLEENLVVGPFQCNCRLLICPETGHAALVDPGDEAERILRRIQELGASGFRTPSGASIEVKYLFHTHGHLDHIGATRGVKEGLASGDSGPVIALHRGDETLYQKLQMQGQFFGFEYDEPLAIEHYFQDGEEISVGTLKFSVLHTPGHSPGSVCLRLHEDSTRGIPETVFSGDTLFKGSVGRTDLWGGDTDQMFKSIRQRVLTLDGATRVCPGHGPETRVEVERKENPFLK